ncbi:YkgJ family cysteine cluster protein [Mesorhizobium silamurunense]|uniref:YkgJ family cysteine cluster protein n=1 Tax=Mesorhizobium silamurunense TaxID=499528 RepID=UPI001786BCD6|nr:YkgJ family cysteine cluster protein [Mesorhizobium silamurunense]
MPRQADRNPLAPGLVAGRDVLSAWESPQPAFDCQSCGACCAYSADWPRFSTEEDAELDRIPEALIAANQSGMRCEGNRCSALRGEVGKGTACAIYDVRPHVCRACMPGGDDCLMARTVFGLAAG